MNVFTCTGNLGNEAEVRQTKSGSSVCTFSMAAKHGYGDSAGTLWIRCTLWGKRAEGKLPEYLAKGTQVAVSGELSTSTWTNRDGVEKTSVELNVTTLDLIGGKQDKPAQKQPNQSDEYQSTGEELPF